MLLRCISYGMTFLWLVSASPSLGYAQSLKKADVLMTADNGYLAPFRIFDNVSYVGDKWVSAFLLETDQGLILIDTLEFPYSTWIPENVRALGHNVEDIKAILITHAHSDHVGGAGYLQSKTGAQVVMLEEDMTLLQQQGSKNGFVLPEITWYPEDGDKFILGNTQVTLYKTPGHTPGCMSLEFTVYHKTVPHRAFVVCGNGTNFQGFGLARQYAASVEKIRRIANQEPKVSVNLSSHPHLGQLFERNEKRRVLRSPNPFVDIDGFNGFIALLAKRGKDKIASERQKRNGDER